MPFLRWRLAESAANESSTALLRFQMSNCRESIEAVSGSKLSKLSESCVLTLSESSRFTLSERSRFALSVTIESPSAVLPTKRNRGTSATTKTMTKSSRNMSVFLLTAAKLQLFGQLPNK